MKNFTELPLLAEVFCEFVCRKGYIYNGTSENGHVGDECFVHYSEVVPSSEVLTCIL